jgi:two-component system cell cycle response regulator
VAATRVLVADDSPLVLRMLEHMLEREGITAIPARDGLEAVEKAFTSTPDLIVLDVVMPRLTGYQACRILKSEPSTRAVPVVLLTNRDEPGDRFWGLLTGADHYLTKDEDPQKLLAFLKDMLAGVPPRPPDAPRHHAGTSFDILARVNELLDRKLFEATVLSEIGRVARNLGRFDETFTSVMTVVSHVVEFAVAGMAFVDGDELDLVVAVHRPSAAAVIEEMKGRMLAAVSREPGGAGVTRIHSRLLQLGRSPGGPEETSLSAFGAIPVEGSEGLAGLLAVGGRKVSPRAVESDPFLAQVASQALIVLQNSRLFQRVRDLSVRDSLTDLFNHRYTVEILRREFERVERYHGGVSVLMIDIDHFKMVNDRYGHPAGDAVLREIARVLLDVLRTSDAVGRYGGEEFLVVVPHTHLEDARQTAERLRQRIENHTFRAADHELSVTVSIGVATYPDGSSRSPDDLIREADAALYRAKEQGRNRVC